MKLESIKIDTAFPEYGTKQLSEALSSGKIIYDKIDSGRNVIYLLEDNPELEDIGKVNKGSYHKAN